MDRERPSGAPRASPPTSAESAEPGGEMPAGLVFFAPGTPPAVRRRRVRFAVLYAVIASALVWPVYPFFSRLSPSILGLPFALSWVIFALGAMFLAVLWLYSGEPAGSQPGGDEREDA